MPICTFIIRRPPFSNGNKTVSHGFAARTIKPLAEALVNGSRLHVVHDRVPGRILSDDNRPQFERNNPVSSDTSLQGFMGTWVGDIDGDSDIDIVTSCKDDGKGYWIENKDGGTKWLMHQLPYDLGGADHSRVHDFNQDGKLDIVMQNYHNKGILYMPSPADPYGNWSHYKIGIGRAGLNLHDVDADGDVDVLINTGWLENPGDPATENWRLREIPGTSGHVKTLPVI